MKRAASRPVFRAVLLLLALAAGAARGAAEGQESPVGWVTAVRRAAGARPVQTDELLAETARKWAQTLAAAGLLSHRGADGSSVLDRYRAQGGTEARVGEILGAGPDLAAVEKGWMASPEHRDLAMDAAWTHVGWGNASAGGAEVWVVLFCEKLVEGLTIESTARGLTVSGTFLPRATDALLFAGLDPLRPSAWDPASRHFSFSVPDGEQSGYFRLGYVSADGAFRLTNAFTLPPGTVSREGQGRSEAPARSP